MTTFTVDTQLFRELGELLVGRESTALVELIKNAYDADATSVLVYGEFLDDIDNGYLVIEDDGIGMTVSEFENGFLRIASRTKVEGDRHSPVFRRRYTGEKGIGRLALHKLSRLVHVESRKWQGGPPTSDGLPSDGSGVDAMIDWDSIESVRTLDQINEKGAINVSEIKEGNVTAGTRITIPKIRRAWSERERNRFHEDIATVVPPPLLVDPLPSNVVRNETLFGTVPIRDSGRKSGGFELELEGDLFPPDSFKIAEARQAHWVLEIDCDPRKKSISYAVCPTAECINRYPESKPLYASVEYPEDEPQVSFTARVLQRHGNTWPARYSGIKVFMEGFRVMPYGERGNDWLSIDYDYRQRGSQLLWRLEPDFSRWIKGLKDEGLAIQGNNMYFGGVFLTHRGAPALQMLVNREGFVEGPTLDFIKNTVRKGIDLIVRTGYAARTQSRRGANFERDKQRQGVEQADVREAPSAWIAREQFGRVNSTLSDAREALSRGDTEALRKHHRELEKELDPLRTVTEDMASETSMLRVLASVGTELAAFTHELNGVLEMAKGLDNQLERLQRDESLSRDVRRRIGDVYRSASDLRRNLERQAAYLVDITSVDARRRRSRQDLASRFDAAARLVRRAAEKRSIKIENSIPKDLRTPPMFPAEVTSMFTNLLTNAVKAAGDEGHVRATAHDTAGSIVVRVENTGVAVDLATSDQWFEAFRSTTSEIDATLGQGMGLGLTITRNMLDEYGAIISFVQPSKGFASAIEVLFPKK